MTRSASGVAPVKVEAAKSERIVAGNNILVKIMYK